MSEKKPQNSRRNNLSTFLTVFFTTLGIIVGVLVLIIYQNPYVILNPFPPAFPSPAIQQQQVDQAIDQTLAALPQITPTPRITETAAPESTATSTPKSPPPTKKMPTNTITPTPDWQVIGINHLVSTLNPDGIFSTATPLPKTGYIYPYIMVHEAYLKESPYNDNVTNPILNCNWIGVAGQVFDIMGNPINGITIRLSGSIKGVEIEQRTMVSGASDLLGEGSFEFKLADEPFTSQNALWLQVIESNGDFLSAKAHFSTTVHCTQNLIQIDFINVQ